MLKLVGGLVWQLLGVQVVWNDIATHPTPGRLPRKGSGHRIGVDLFHVKMPHLFGALAV